MRWRLVVVVALTCAATAAIFLWDAWTSQAPGSGSKPVCEINVSLFGLSTVLTHLLMGQSFGLVMAGINRTA